MSVAADACGAEGAPSVVFLHGGGQTRHSWGAAVDELGQAGFRAITVDLRGHGDSDWSTDGRYDLDVLSDDLRAVIATLPDRPALVGASLGGLTSLLLAGEAPDLVCALVMVDVVPQIEPDGAEKILGFMTASPDGFATVDEAADAVAAYLPHREKRSSGTGLMKNLRLREDGRYRWHWDPRMLEQPARGAAEQWRGRLEAAATHVRVPTLLIRGGISQVVSMEGVEAFRALILHMEFANIADADHMVAGDENDAFATPLRSFLERTA
ncbi:MAG: alpha/beta fold hydrolase [Sphingobium sp.]